MSWHWIILSNILIKFLIIFAILILIIFWSYFFIIWSKSIKFGSESIKFLFFPAPIASQHWVPPSVFVGKHRSWTFHLWNPYCQVGSSLSLLSSSSIFGIPFIFFLNLILGPFYWFRSWFFFSKYSPVFTYNCNFSAAFLESTSSSLWTGNRKQSMEGKKN